MAERTVFHKIIAKELPATVAYEDDDVLAIHDIHPKAPLHLLFIPKKFAVSIAAIDASTDHLPGLLILTAKKFADVHGIVGYTLTFHVGREGGQEIDYLHLHFLSNQKL
jgi:histidine triad (HIT) family protein